MSRFIVSVVALLGSHSSLADAYIEARCQANTEGGACLFTNTGEDAGSGCANVVLTQAAGGGTTAASPACSGTLQPSEKKTVPLVFTGPSPAALCIAPEAPTELRCNLTVTMSDVKAQGGILGLVPFIVLLTSIGVFIDARRIGARKGLVTGMGDISPAGWLVACLLLWIVAFPLYLAKRSKIAAAARAAKEPSRDPAVAPSAST